MSNASSPTPSFLNFQLKFQMRLLIDQQFRLPGMKDTWLSKVRIFPLALSSSIVLLFEVDILHGFFFFVSLWSLALLDLALQSCLWHPPHFASGARAVQTCATIQILVAHSQDKPYSILLGTRTQRGNNYSNFIWSKHPLLLYFAFRIGFLGAVSMMFSAWMITAWSFWGFTQHLHHLTSLLSPYGWLFLASWWEL